MSGSNSEIPLCQHIKVNGVQCGSPAIHRRHFCHFHAAMRDQARRRRKATKHASAFPVLEDANAIQCAIMQTIDDLLNDRIDYKRASLVLYALQTATLNLRRTSFEPSELWDEYYEDDKPANAPSKADKEELRRAVQSVFGLSQQSAPA
ncbi:MAG: hypothetical protein ACE14L_02495 [Terriglobales bacterium]